MGWQKKRSSHYLAGACCCCSSGTGLAGIYAGGGVNLDFRSDFLLQTSFQCLCRTMHKKLTSAPLLLLCELFSHPPTHFRPFAFSAALHPRFYVPVCFVLRPAPASPCIRLLFAKSCEPFFFRRFPGGFLENWYFEV